MVRRLIALVCIVTLLGWAASTRAATCRDSRLPPSSSWPLDAGGNRYLRLEVDVDADGLADVLEATSSSGSGFESTSVQLTLGRAGVRLRADETFDFSAITAVNPVPRELLDPRHRAALPWIEEALFPRICASPDPSLAWLLDPKKRLTWIQGPPEMPDFYAVRLAALAWRHCKQPWRARSTQTARCG